MKLSITSSKTSQINNVTIVVLSNEKSKHTTSLIQNFAEQCIDYYIQKLGFYPHEALVIVPGEDYCSGGYPIGKGVIALHQLDKFDEKSPDYWEWLVAHEIGHMYWGFHVLESENKWLTTGLGLYLDQLFVQERDIQDNFHKKIVSQFMKAKADGKNISFNLTSDQIKSLDFDYNSIINHGRGYYEVKAIETLLGSERFFEIHNGLLRDFENVPLTFTSFIDYIKKNYASNFNYSVE